MDTFAELIERHMIQNNITDQELATALGLRRETIFRWRSGYIKSPRDKEIRKCGVILKLAKPELDALLAIARRDRVVKGSAKKAQQRAELEAEKLAAAESDRIVPIITRPIEQPRQFFAHKQVLNEVISCWQQGALEHVLITGPKRSGKSSLLHYLQNDNQSKLLRHDQEHIPWTQPLNWVYINFLSPSAQREDYLLRFILTELSLLDYLDPKQPLDLISFSEIIEAHLRTTTIILMDNIETGLACEGLDDNFWYYLRNLREFSPIAFCGTSRLSESELNALAENQNKVSPFINVFLSIELKPLPDDVAMDLLSYAGDSLSSADKKTIVKQSKGWPAILQSLCHVWLNWQGDIRTQKAAQVLQKHQDLLGTAI
jgi:hypothetical protein